MLKGEDGEDGEDGGDSPRSSSDDWSSEEERDEENHTEDTRALPVECGPPTESRDGGKEDCSGGDGGVLRRRVVAGEKDRRASERWEVRVKYVVREAGSGEVLDVSRSDMWANKEHRFVVGAGEVMRGMEVIGRTMEKGEISRFWVRCHDYGFGKEGCPPKIRPGVEWLMIDAEMMGVEQPRRSKLFFRSHEVMPYVVERKEKGNQFYKAGQMMKAVHEYKECLKAINTVDEPSYMDELKPSHVAILGNLAAAHLVLKNWRRTIKYCTAALNIDSDNEKALFRRAQALRQFPDRLEEARKDLGEAIRVNPKNKQLREEYAALQEEVKQKRSADKASYGGAMFKESIYYERDNQRVFFEIAQGKKLLGRIEMELFFNKVPKTCQNFLELCIGEKEGLSYQKTIFHRVIEGYIVQGGDVTMAKGAGGRSIYGPFFDDESLTGKCNRAGLLCMANSGPNTNQSQFFITLVPCPQLEGQYVVFGKVVKGTAVLRKMEKVAVDSEDAPLETLFVFKSGRVKEKDRMLDDDDDDDENAEE